MNLVIALLVLLLILAFIENMMHQRALKKIPIRILVNGTRGQTTTTRLLAAALREKGIRTYAKTTGSDAEIIKDDGKIEILKRRLGVRLTESIAFVRKAEKAGCECIVVECMALHEESQKIMASKFIKPTHTVIINTLSDHMDAMGNSREEVAWTLSRSVSPDTKLYVCEDLYDSLEVKELHKVKTGHYDHSSPVTIPDEDMSIAVEILKDFGLGEDDVLKASLNVAPDIGLHNEITFPCGSVLIPTFSINDEESMDARLIEEFKKKGRRLSLVFNNRKDREFRIYYLKNIIQKNRDKIGKVYIIGDYRNKVARYIRRKCSIDAVISNPEELRGELERTSDIFIGLGNIKGAGEHLIKLCM